MAIHKFKLKKSPSYEQRHNLGILTSDLSRSTSTVHTCAVIIVCGCTLSL